MQTWEPGLGVHFLISSRGVFPSTECGTRDPLIVLEVVTTHSTTTHVNKQAEAYEASKFTQSRFHCYLPSLGA